MTELVFIMDKSGSMQGMEEDVVGGFNSVLKKQKEESEQGFVTSVLFSNQSEIVIDRVLLKEVRPMDKKDYVTMGCTAMYDAIGFTIDHISNVHKYIRKEDRPDKTIVVITTDGMENASTKYSSTKVKQMIEKKKEAGWEFLFLAANIDASDTAEMIGIEKDCSVDYHNDAKGTAVLFESVASFISECRSPKGKTGNWRVAADEDYSSRK